MEKETVTRAFRYVDDQGTVRDVEITVRKDIGTRFAVDVPMYYDEQGIGHNIIGMLVERSPELQHIDLEKSCYSNGKPVIAKGRKTRMKAPDCAAEKA